MPGRTPGPGAEPRVREAGWIVLPAEGRDGDPPPLEDVKLDPVATRFRWELWETWWSSPMALMWSEWDAPQLERVLHLAMAAWAGAATAAMLSELRQLEDRFGLNPVARRKLFWRIEGVDVPSTEADDLSGGGAGGAPLPEAGSDDDPRQPLKIIEGGKAG